MTDARTSRDVDDVIITDELDRRPSRAPDYAAENRAFATLARTLAERPGQVLQKLTDLLVEMGVAESAGISLWRDNRFHWDALSGAWGHLKGAGMAFDASPCGVVIGRDETLLLKSPERVFPDAGIDPLISEILLVPFHIEDRPVGTLWALSHREERRFDREDARILQSLARLASAAHQMVLALQTAEASQQALGRELGHMRRLHALVARITTETDLKAALDEIVSVACEIAEADRGCIRLVTEDGARLEMFAWRGRGCDGPFINQFRFEELKPGWDGVHGERERLVVEDWSQVPDVWASNAGDVLRAEQVRASQSTPIIGRRNQTIGALNTHWSAPYRPSDEQLRLIDLLAWTAADFIERHRALAALQQTEERFRQFGEASSDVLWIRDADSLRWEYLSPAFEAIYGTPVADAMRGDTLRNWADIIVPEDREDALAAIRRVSAGEFVSFEYRVMRADGQLRWLRNSDFPIRDAAGDVVRIGGVGHDITAVKWAQQHQQTLLAELQHRVRNTLSVIKSIARRTAESSRSVDEYAAHLDGRIEAFSRVQAIVTRNPGDGVSFRTLVEDEMLAHAMREGPQLHIRGPDLRLNPRAAESMSLAVHELATNAVKHGALSAPHGRIAAHWSVTDGRFDFDWTETCVADAMEAPQGDGFGMELLLRSLPYDLDAITNAAFGPQGLKFTLSAPAQLLLTQDVTAPA